MTDRAVSDLVGFILIFSIILTGATFALTIGQDHLTDVQTHEQTQNAERAMVLIGQNLDQIGYSRSDSTSGTVNLNDGRIRLGADSNVTVTVGRTSGSSERFGNNFIGSLVYEQGDTLVSYENGMVIRSDSGNGIALTDPEFSCTDDRAIVSLVTLNGTEGRQIGSGRVSIDAFQNETRLLYPLNRTGRHSAVDATNVSVEINSTHADVWDGTLRDDGWVPDGDEHRCDVGEDGRVYVRQTVIDVTFQR